MPIHPEHAHSLIPLIDVPVWHCILSGSGLPAHSPALEEEKTSHCMVVARFLFITAVPDGAPTILEAVSNLIPILSRISAVSQILWKEWGDVKPEYHSSNWPLESLKAGAVAIRSWLYFHASPHAPWGCKRSSCKVNQSEEDLVWMTIAPTFPATYTSAMLESSNIYIWYNYYYDELLGAYIRKPADAMFADRTGHWSKDGSLNADGSNNGKVYLQSHESPPDQFVESYRPAGYAPGMSQRGTKDWIVGFIDGTGTLRKMQSYGQLLSYHYPGTGTAMARY